MALHGAVASGLRTMTVPSRGVLSVSSAVHLLFGDLPKILIDFSKTLYRFRYLFLSAVGSLLNGIKYFTIDQIDTYFF